MIVHTSIPVVTNLCPKEEQIFLPAIAVDFEETALSPEWRQMLKITNASIAKLSVWIMNKPERKWSDWDVTSG